jgi:acyl carrier protein
MNIPIDQFISTLEQELQLEAGLLSPTDLLSDIPEFDSLGRLSLIAMCDTNFGFVLKIPDLDACVTVSDFHSVVERNATRA